MPPKPLCLSTRCFTAFLFVWQDGNVVPSHRTSKEDWETVLMAERKFVRYSLAVFLACRSNEFNEFVVPEPEVTEVPRPRTRSARK